MSESKIRYRVELFAHLKEHTGQDNWIHESDAPLLARQLLNAFFDGYPTLDRLRGVTRIAVNHVFCQGDVLLNPKDELALIPPVSGG
uniref:Molybdopterin synthase sulfur carrier subunit n=1 Tax=Candidatus Kentrum sp. MB TaxID=2138164 RepID=A0A450XX46_9GAMM|nr:MAG: molybdopterin synthase catalytic subunit/molybdopterin synthase sulfur carrier subunit [Candidatus Kentron sp. MB]VFK33835.1 MAG: molybdopterin synthase catalytic subunit/molybdopterin synthase sulfur carrier subunit [Candidatus Kentron sp. MB]VFK76428.1 MAG: molybdopterin synthase catalytic subunit/molybdopterin synthase sulfur carrier subunit [Candidatus Kentron sp. MB]